MALELAVGAHERRAPAREPGARGPHLLPADRELAVADAPDGAHRGEVRARARLREPLAPELARVEHPRQEALLLGLVAEVHQRRADHVDADAVDQLGHAGAGELLRQHRLGREVEPRAAEALRPREPDEARAVQRALPRDLGLDARAVVLRRRARVVAVQPLAHAGAQRVLLGAERQRRGGERVEVHASPSSPAAASTGAISPIRSKPSPTVLPASARAWMPSTITASLKCAKAT